MDPGAAWFKPRNRAKYALPQSCAVSEQRDLGEQIAVENG